MALGKCKKCGAIIIVIPTCRSGFISFDQRENMVLVPDLTGDRIVVQGHVLHQCLAAKATIDQPQKAGSKE